MDDLPVRPRKVFILGRGADLDVEAVAHQVQAEGAELVLVSVGHPAAAAQAAIVGDALRLADELRLWVDAALVTSAEQISELLVETDEVSVLASGAERRRLERALGRR